MSIFKYERTQPLSSRHLPETAGVYEVVCLPTGQRYIGSTSNFKTRVRMHRYRGRTLTHTPSFNEAWAQYGEAAFKMRVLEQTDNYAQREREIIRDAIEAGEQLFNINTFCKRKPAPEIIEQRRQVQARRMAKCEAARQAKQDNIERIIDIFTSSEPPKVLQQRWGVSHACVSLIKSGKRCIKTLRQAGLV